MNVVTLPHRHAGVRGTNDEAGGMCMNSGADTNSRIPRILVVDDDATMRSMLSEYLQHEYFYVSSASNVKEAMRLLSTSQFVLIILDLRLGEDDGLDLLRELRSKENTPVIIVTGHRRDEVDRVVGLELGADDYMMKPFSLRELLARIRAILRRVEIGRNGTSQISSSTARFAGWTLDRRARRLHNPKGTLVELTKGEYALLSAFVEAPGRPLTREFLLDATRIHDDVFDRTIDVQILRLRRKIDADPRRPCMIKTERGHGYTFAVQVETSR